MTTASEGVAVIATQVARTDRRALSQAWYSALHLAHRTNPGPAPAGRRESGAAPALLQRTAAAHDGAQRAQTPDLPARAARRATASGAAPAAERRRTPCETARRIERAVVAVRTRVNGHAALTVDVAGGRVRLLVRSERGTTRIVALCSGPLRDPVERALARARFTLAAAGRTEPFA